MSDVPAPDSAVARQAEALLSDVLGGPIRLDDGEQLQERTYVQRFRVLDGPASAPASVVVKRPRPQQEAAQSAPDERALQNFFNDWAGLQFLSAVAGDAALCPGFLAGDPATGMMIIEDLGSGEGIHSFLLGDNAATAESALLALAATLGTMHAHTMGQEATFNRIRHQLGAQPTTSETRQFDWFAEGLHSVLNLLGVNAAPGTDDDLRTVIEAANNPGPFLAYTHGDPCPDNCLRVGAQIRLIDFEIGAFRHALTDGVYGRILFPTCWCVGRLPSAIPQRMEQTYRAALSVGCPEAADDALFGRAVAQACAYWVLIMCARYDIPRLLNEDHEWGIATVRQRVLVRAERFAQTADEFGHLEALGATFRSLAAHLSSLWPPEVNELTLYPAFR